MNKPPKVSVCLITYNQEKYVRYALEGAVKQRFSGNMEIIASDDCSTDNTLQIIREYAARYPSIKVLANEANTGMHRNWEKALQACTGDYVALLEGDDFWNDELKLEKQVNILEADKSVAISITNSHVINEVDDIYYPEYVLSREVYYTMSDLLKSNFFPTCGVVFRNRLFKELPAAYFRSPYADWIIHILNAQHGRLHLLNEKTCTYRLHPGGVFGKSNEQKRLERTVQAYNCICEILEKTPWKQEAGKTGAMPNTSCANIF